MHRRGFVTALGATVAAGALPGPARAAIDEPGMGRDVFGQLRDDGEILFNSPYYEHLNEVGSVIAATVAKRYPEQLRFYIVKGETANAFSVPGGSIYVNEPLLDLVRNRDELAGVLAHESGHMVLHHVAKRIANQKTVGTLAQIGSILAQIFTGPLIGAGADYALQNLYSGQDANLSRHIEAQADEEGARIVAATGVYNPWGMIWFFQIMTATYGMGRSGYFNTHPIDRQRIDDLIHLFRTDTATFAKYSDTQQRETPYW